MERHGTVIGTGFDTLFGQETQQLERGDRFILCTDGLINNFGVDDEGECKNSFYRALQELHRFALQDWVDKVFDRSKALRGTTPPNDDMSLLAIEYTPPL